MKKINLFWLILLVIQFSVSAQNKPPAKSPVNKQAVLSDFMSKRFGMFIHYGPVTLRGTEIGWSRNDQVAQADYDSLYREFNPVLFNADAWVKAAKDAGMKYLTITAKHHDGFCLWPTKFSAYNIMNSPFKRDIVGELARACKKQGVTFCIYFTVLDFHDPDYPLHHMAADTKGNMPAFVKRMKNELKELITNYHPYMLWFDGNWEAPWTKEYATEVYQYINSLDPKIIVNNRLGKGAATEFTDQSVGDYLTPEQQIGKLNMKDPWESCITICNQWAWAPNDKMKSLKTCIETLVKTSSGNGNLLFNVGPMMDGRMEARQVKRLKEIGDWLKIYGSSIYATKGGPYQITDQYATTRKGNKLFIHLFSGAGVLNLTALPAVKITKAYFMNGGQVTYSQDAAGAIKLNLPSVLPDSSCSVIVLETDKNTEDLPII